MPKVKSSNIDSLEYAKELKVLLVKFNSGSLYAYMKVPKRVYEDFLAADSKGKYFNVYVKEHFSFVKLSV